MDEAEPTYHVFVYIKAYEYVPDTGEKNLQKRKSEGIQGIYFMLKT
jgi:hypothetical protein